MSQLESEIKLLDQISEYYHNQIIGTLETKESSILKTLKALIKDQASKFSLVSENSIHESIYANVTSRVKGKVSFREKLIRKNLGLKLIRDIGLTEANFNSKKGELEQNIEQFDDIIGLRVVCDLNKDCKSALKLITNNLEFLKGEKIVFLDGETKNQPQKMKNGLSIYRLKGIYDDRFGFELQIKSKIEEAWGELDHSIFYKDYSFFPTKDAVQQTMNNVGHLLDEIENLLFDLRHSRDHYNKNVKRSIFLEKLEKGYAKSVKHFLGFSYQLERLSDVLGHIFSAEKTVDVEPGQELLFDHLSYTCEPHLAMFLHLRNTSFELQLIEAIYRVIWEVKNGNSLTQENYQNFLDSLLGHLLENILKNVSAANELVDYEKEDLLKDIQFLIQCECDQEVLISSKKHTSFLEIKLKVRDLIHELFEEKIEDEKLSEENMLNAIQPFLTCHFEANIDQAIDKSKDDWQTKILMGIKEHLSSKGAKKVEETVLDYSIKITNRLS